MTALVAYAAWGGVRVLRCLAGELVSQLTKDGEPRPLLPARGVAITNSRDFLLIAVGDQLFAVAAQDDGGVCRKPLYGSMPLPEEARLLAAAVDRRGRNVRAVVATPERSLVIDILPNQRSQPLTGPAVSACFVDGTPVVVETSGAVGADVGWVVEAPWLSADALTTRDGSVVVAALQGDGVTIARRDSTGEIERRWLAGQYADVTLVREKRFPAEPRLVTVTASGGLGLHQWTQFAAPSARTWQAEPVASAAPIRVFVSYAHTGGCERATLDEGDCCVNHELARKVVDLLGEEGFHVWWDAMLPRDDSYAVLIQDEVDAADVMIILWSATSEEQAIEYERTTVQTGQLMELLYARECMSGGRLRPIAIVTAGVKTKCVNVTGFKYHWPLQLDENNNLEKLRKNLLWNVRNERPLRHFRSATRSTQI